MTTLSIPPPTMPYPNIPKIFTSLTRHPWTLLRILKSANPHDIQGPLHGTASFTSLPPSTTSTTSPPPKTESLNQTLYTETGTLPTTLGQNLQWKKSYIWRLSPTSNALSVWFVKVAEPDVADYLFHGMEFLDSSGRVHKGEDGVEGGEEEEEGEGDKEGYVSAPVPPEVSGETVVVTARGNHLCINDMYRTAYAFRIREEDGEVVSWASRHVVRGPKKDQDIVNYYSV